MILISTTSSLTILFAILALGWNVPALAYVAVFFLVLTGFFALCEHQARIWQTRLSKMLEEMDL